ncbi:uncharacterized protein DSM5745_11386 [Aspergillus mulundensis]|uniref:Uncharacterized protein n=1 Tax=Aspergillus mulundensis TaxID=1810919 RepID=A0A3D8Q8A8_9EURO|nr:hypothetical protein DSM5745_11386 [Aspergillus mulundensis]RDW57868.1 hypothetical protein DSM5745_11386 [Aspergillus mulundensis]
MSTMYTPQSSKVPDQKTTGISLTAPVSWFIINSAQNARCAAWLVRHFIRPIITTGCNNYHVQVRFHKPSERWIVDLSAWEFDAVGLGTEWTDEIRTKFRESKYIAKHLVRERAIDMDDWVKPFCGQESDSWERGTWFKCYLGYPFILQKEGRLWIGEIGKFNVLVNLVASAPPGVPVDAERMVEVARRTDETKDLLAVLDILYPKRERKNRNKRSGGGGSSGDSDCETETDTDSDSSPGKSKSARRPRPKR